MRRIFLRWSTAVLLLLLLAACSLPAKSTLEQSEQVIGQGEKTGEAVSAAQFQRIPVFDHVVWVVLENRDYGEVIGSADMPYLNQLAKENVLLEDYYAVRHPSLPNYLALIGGDTFDITDDCIDCYVNAPSLPDRLEAAGRTWKTYQEDMPSPCFAGNDGEYVQRHNPFMYFDPIRLDAQRCKSHVVPMDALKKDMASNALPNFVFLSPNLCHSGHDCGPQQVDAWLKQVIEPLRKSEAMGKNSLIAIVYDEAKMSNKDGCCVEDRPGGGRVAAVLISPLAKPGFRDKTTLSHYSLLKTVLLSWGLPDLGETKEIEAVPITSPWK